MGPYWALLGLTGPYWTLLALTGPYWALLDLTGPHWALLGLTECYRALLGLTGPYGALLRGGHSGGAGGAQATPGILIFQKQVTLFTKSGDTLELE